MLSSRNARDMDSSFHRSSSRVSSRSISSSSSSRHDKIIQLKRLLSSDPIDWEHFLHLDKELKGGAITVPSLKCSLTWIISKYPPSYILRELLTRYQDDLFSNNMASTCNSLFKECLKTALEYRNAEFIRFVAWKEKRLLCQPLDNEGVYHNFSNRLQVRSGDLALHHAGNLEIATILVQAYPEGIKIQNKDGDLPIHVAMKHYKSVDHVKFLITEGKRYDIDGSGGVLVKNRYGETPFSILCKQIATGVDVACLTFPFYSDDLRLWEKLNLVLRSCYLDSRMDCSCSCSNIQNEDTFQILHAIITSGCPHQAIIMAIIIKPEQIKQMDRLGRYPLSLCANQLMSCPKSTLLKVLQSYPEAIYLPDNNGRLCLHWAAASGRKLEDGIDDILTAYPGGLRIADKEGMLPFMLAASSATDSLDAVYHLLRECPEFFSSI